MQQAPLQVAVAIDSTHQGHLGPIVARQFAGQAEHRLDGRIELDGRADLPVTEGVSGRGIEGSDGVDLVDSPVTDGVVDRRIETSDGVVLGASDDRSFPGCLKIGVDLAFAELCAKTGAFVSYDGISGGRRVQRNPLSCHALRQARIDRLQAA